MATHIFSTPAVVFSESGYILDSTPDSLTPQGRVLLDSFAQDKNSALYRLGLGGVPADADPAFRYLQLVSERTVCGSGSKFKKCTCTQYHRYDDLCTYLR